MNEYSYEEYCKVIGEIVLSFKAQLIQAQKLIESQNKQIAELQKENRHYREMYPCNIATENMS